MLINSAYNRIMLSQRTLGLFIHQVCLAFEPARPQPIRSWNETPLRRRTVQGRPRDWHPNPHWNRTHPILLHLPVDQELSKESPPEVLVQIQHCVWRHGGIELETVDSQLILFTVTKRRLRSKRRFQHPPSNRPGSHNALCQLASCMCLSTVASQGGWVGWPLVGPGHSFNFLWGRNLFVYIILKNSASTFLKFWCIQLDSLTKNE